MSRRNLGGFIRPGYNPLRVPNAPTIGTATGGDKQASVAFTAPSCVGGGAITGYTAVSSCGAKFASGASSPITVGCLTNCTAYTFKVYANNSFGPSAYSASSNSVTPAKTCATYTTPGTYSWVAPTGVTSVSVVAIGGGGAGGARTFIYCPCGSFYQSGGGGGGGALAYTNSYSVTPGNSYTVVVGAGATTPSCPGTRSTGGNSSFGGGVITAKGGEGALGVNRGSGGLVSAGTGYAGGNGATGTTVYGSCASGAGGGGAGGYSGKGGNGSCAGACNATAGSGGGGGGGGNGSAGNGGGGGGGVGIYGQGSNGTAGGLNAGGGGGSGGTSGAAATACTLLGGAYGGGGGGTSYSPQRNTNGGGGAVRIVWPGTTRQFPSTNVGA